MEILPIFYQQFEFDREDLADTKIKRQYWDLIGMGRIESKLCLKFLKFGKI